MENVSKCHYHNNEWLIWKEDMKIRWMLSLIHIRLINKLAYMNFYFLSSALYNAVEPNTPLYRQAYCFYSGWPYCYCLFRVLSCWWVACYLHIFYSFLNTRIISWVESSPLPPLSGEEMHASIKIAFLIRPSVFTWKVRTAIGNILG